MKNLTLIFSFLFLFSSAITGQSISGVVNDNNDQAIFFATIALYNAQDSSLVSAVSTDENGKFVIVKLEEGEYYLESSMLSYDTERISDIKIPEDAERYFSFVLGPDATLLKTVEIKARVPLLEQKAEKLIVNVADNITNTSGSLLDVMKKVPGMLVVNDRLSMVGSGSPTILLNGKSTQYMDIQSLLKDMPGDNIQKVEIIHQPGAEYEASVSGPIINIVMKKNALFGTNGSISIGAGKGELWDYTTGLNLSHFEGPINIMGGLGYTKNAYVEEIALTRRLSNISNQLDGTYDQLNRDAARPRTYRGNLRVDWDVTNNHRLGIEGKYYNNNNERIATNVTTVDLVSDPSSSYRLDTDNDIKRSWNYTSINPYYIYESDSSGHKLELDLNLASYNLAGVNTLTTTSPQFAGTDVQRYGQPGSNMIFASSLDYTKTLNDVFSLKLGTKFSSADLDNNLQSDFLDEAGLWQNNVSQSNHYLFNEDIYAAYTKLNFNSGDWSGAVGLRYEQSKSVGESLTIDSTLTRDISKLFPSFSLSKKLSSALTSTVSYSYRIDRPRYSTLNPFVYYLDPFTYEQGNPNIRPELTHSGKFTLSFEGQPFFNVEYKKSNDAIVEVTRQEPNSEEASKTDLNFDSRDAFSTSLFFPLEFIPGVNGYGGVIVSNTAYNSLYNDGLFERSKWNTTTFFQAEFNLPGDINAELGGWYSSANQEGIFNSEHLYGTSFAVSKKFLDDKAKVSLGVEDFVNRFWHASVDYQQDMDLIVRWQAPVVNARFSYKFGNQHLKSKSKRSSSASEEIRRASQNN